MEYYTMMKKNELLLPLKPWMNLTDLMLNKGKQIFKKLFDFIYMKFRNKTKLIYCDGGQNRGK